MLAEPTLVLIDRLVATLMALVEAATAAIKIPTQALDFDAATALLDRAANLVLRLITLSNFGLRTRKPKTDTPNDRPTPDPTPTDRPRTTQFPRRRGWLLEALPDLAPTIAADLQTILADPATQSLLESAPTLNRAFRPLLRGLALDHPQPTTPPKPPAPPPPPPPKPHTRRWQETYRTPTITIPGLTPQAPPQNPFPRPKQTHAHFIPISQQSFSGVLYRTPPNRPSTNPPPATSLTGGVPVGLIPRL